MNHKPQTRAGLIVRGLDEILKTAAITRREIVRALGLTAVIAVPLVTSIVAPTATQAATCLPAGSNCSSSAQCCSEVCNNSICA